MEAVNSLAYEDQEPEITALEYVNTGNYKSMADMSKTWINPADIGWSLTSCSLKYAGCFGSYTGGNI